MKSLVAVLAVILPAGTIASPLFHLQYVPGTSLQAQLGFQAAAARWPRALKDNVTIDLTAGFNSLGGNILGQTGSSEAFYRYSDFRSALAADATSAIGQQALAHLPTGDSFGMPINRTANNPNGPGCALPYVDNNGDANNHLLSLSNAEAKAVGLAPPQSLDGCIGNCDGFIQFNSDFNVDFDPGDGDQASHWRDKLHLGIMDPTVAHGELLRLRWNDVIALDAIGWDIAPAAIPAPGTVPLLCLALMLLAVQQRRQIR